MRLYQHIVSPGICQQISPMTMSTVGSDMLSSPSLPLWQSANAPWSPQSTTIMLPQHTYIKVSFLQARIQPWCILVTIPVLSSGDRSNRWSKELWALLLENGTQKYDTKILAGKLLLAGVTGLKSSP